MYLVILQSYWLKEWLDWAVSWNLPNKSFAKCEEHSSVFKTGLVEVFT